MSSAQLYAMTAFLVTSASMVLCSQQLAPMVSITLVKTQLQVKIASNAHLVTTVFRELTNLGNAHQAPIKSLKDKQSAVIAQLALSAGSPVWLLQCPAPQVHSKLRDNA